MGFWTKRRCNQCVWVARKNWFSCVLFCTGCAGVTNAMAFTFVKSKRGKDKLAHGGYLYCMDRDNADGSTSWRCDQKLDGRRSCKGRVKTSGDAIQLITEHSCALNPARIQVAVAVTDARQRAADTQEPARRIIANATSTLSEEEKANIPKYNTIRRQLARVRQREQAPHPVPQSLEEINVPPALSVTKANALFLLHDSGPQDPDRFLIFATERNMQTLDNNVCWCVDGTFKVCPELFHQLWTIHGIVSNAVLPLVYVLMTRKTEELYNRVLDAICAGRQLAPQFVVSDFELAAINSFKAHFPAAEMHGCFFHLAQSLWRQVQSLGYRDRYATEEDFRVRVKMIASLAFVRIPDVIATFEMLVDLYGDDDEYLDLLNYFEVNYVRNRNRRRQVRYPIELWNCHHITANDLPRTNNNVEGWHRAFEDMVGASHPTIYRFIESIQLEQSLMETRRARIDRGERYPLYARKEYEANNERLKNLINDYDNSDRIHFLRTCSHAFDF